MISCTQPVRKQRSTAPWAPKLCRFSLVSIAMMAVGPIGLSLQLPNIVYTKHATNDEYKPYCNTQIHNSLLQTLNNYYYLRIMVFITYFKKYVTVLIVSHFDSLSGKVFVL